MLARTRPQALRILATWRPVLSSRGMSSAEPGAARSSPTKPQTPPPDPANEEQPKAPPRVSDRGPLDWRSLTVILGLGTAGLAYYSHEKQSRMREIMGVKTIGRAAVGGPFELLDNDGAVFTDKDLLGRWTLIYFGFTMCPDVCPDELTKVSEALDILANHGKTIGPTEASDISPVLISIDPERDTPKRTHEYAVGFHKAFIGLSGSMDQARVAAKAYRVYFSKGDVVADDDYLVDHSIITYLMDPNGEFQDFYAKNVSATEMAARIESKMLSWKQR